MQLLLDVIVTKKLINVLDPEHIYIIEYPLNFVYMYYDLNNSFVVSAVPLVSSVSVAMFMRFFGDSIVPAVPVMFFALCLCTRCLGDSI